MRLEDIAEEMTPEERRDAIQYDRSCGGCIRLVLVALGIVAVMTLVSRCVPGM